VITSPLAAVAVALGTFSRPYVTILTAIPAFALVVDRVFLFYERSQWHGTEFLRLEELLFKLQFQNATAKEISEEYCKIRKEMEPLYPGFGALRLPRLTPKAFPLP